MQKHAWNILLKMSGYFYSKSCEFFFFLQALFWLEITVCLVEASYITLRTSFCFFHRKCPRTNRINRQKQNTMHYNSENTLRASTRLIWATTLEQRIMGNVVWTENKNLISILTETLHPTGWWDGGWWCRYNGGRWVLHTMPCTCGTGHKQRILGHHDRTSPVIWLCMGNISNS